MPGVVVHSPEHYVFKRQAALVGEIIVAQQLYHIFDWHCLLHRHQRRAFCRVGGVDGYGYMHLCGLDQGLQLLDFADGADSYAFRAPGQPPRSGQYLDCVKHRLQVVERFAHAHEHQVGERLAFRDGEYLVHDVGRREVAVETLPPCHAERAVHLASGL